MIGQISASNQLRTSSELAPNMFGAISELASVMEFGFYSVYEFTLQRNRKWELRRNMEGNVRRAFWSYNLHSGKYMISNKQQIYAKYLTQITANHHLDLLYQFSR